MGQRLVVSFKKEGKTLVNCYFHWSAYTDSALGITEDLVNVLSEGIPSDIASLVDVFKQLQNYSPCISISRVKSTKELGHELSKEDVDSLEISDEEKQILLNLLENRYILLVDNAYDNFGNRLENYYNIFEGDANRNAGLISVFKKDMEESDYYSEGDVIINLDTKTVSFQVLGYIGDSEGFGELGYVDFDDDVPESERTLENYFKGRFVDLSGIDVDNIKFEDFNKFSNLLFKVDGEAYDKNNDIVISKIQ